MPSIAADLPPAPGNVSDLLIDGDATALAHLVANATAPLSLRLRGTFNLPALSAAGRRDGWLTVGSRQRVTLWSSDGATLDARGNGRVLVVKAGGQLRLENVSLENGFTSAANAANGGGCVLVDDDILGADDTFFSMRGGRIAHCTTEGQSAGGILVATGTVELDVVRIEECVARQEGAFARGGALGVQAGDVTLRDVTFVNTSATSSSGWAYGGAIAVWGGSSHLTLHRVGFHRAFTTSVTGQAWGGGAAVLAGRLELHEGIFYRTRVHSESDIAYGGGIGFFGGTSTIFETSFDETFATTGTSHAFGGAIGMEGGLATVYNSTCAGGEAVATNGVGVGGGVGMAFGGALSLNNVTVIGSRASSDFGVAIIAEPPTELTATLLTISQECNPAMPNQNASLVSTRADPAPVLLRNLTVDAPNCPLVLGPSVELIQCGASRGFAPACGPGALCRTNQGARVPTPLCTCRANDPSQPFKQSLPNPNALSVVLAPYTLGCVPPSVEERDLNRNFWRLSNHTSDIHTCATGEGWSGWRPGQPTPCAGGVPPADGWSASAYCDAASGTSGPLCRVCLPDSHGQKRYFDGVAACLDCPAQGTAALALPLGLLLAGALLVLVVYVSHRERVRLCTSASSRRMGELVDRGLEYVRRFRHQQQTLGISYVAKLKLAVSYYQASRALARPSPTLLLQGDETLLAMAGEAV